MKISFFRFIELKLKWLEIFGKIVWRVLKAVSAGINVIGTCDWYSKLRGVHNFIIEF